MDLKPSSNMQKVCTQLAGKYGINLYEDDIPYLRLDMPGFDRLCIERVWYGPILISVGHYFEMNSDLVSEPQVTFWVRNSQWIPVDIEQSIIGYRRYVEIGDGHTTAKILDLSNQHDLAQFTEDWAENIRNQNWLECGSRWEHII